MKAVSHRYQLGTDACDTDCNLLKSLDKILNRTNFKA
jgi:hypothetical protein